MKYPLLSKPSRCIINIEYNLEKHIKYVSLDYKPDLMDEQLCNALCTPMYNYSIIKVSIVGFLHLNFLGFV